MLIANPSKFTCNQINNFKNLGYKIAVWSDESKLLNKDLYDSEVVICNSLFIKNDLSNFNNLKMIQLMSVGLDRVPVKEIKDKGIRLENAGDVYSIPIAEWVILKILEIYKDSRHFERAQIESEWKKNRNLIELNGKVLGILGTGNIGIEISRRAKAFGVNTLGFNTTGNNVPTFDACYKVDELKLVIKGIDILVIALPLTDSTKNLVDQNVIKSMKKSAILVNVSRGGILNESYLLEALNSNHLQAAALDVFIEEPLPKNSPLWGNSKILISPHNSFVSDNTNERLYQLIYKNLKSLINQQ